MDVSIPKDVFPKRGYRYMFGAMATEPIITNERVDDLPILLTQIERMGVKKLIDKHFPTHGNWQGKSLGSIAGIWLAHIIIASSSSFKSRPSLGL